MKYNIYGSDGMDVKTFSDYIHEFLYMLYWGFALAFPLIITLIVAHYARW